MTKQEFVSAIYPYIVKECTERGYNFPVAVLAHACRESGWNKSQLSEKYHNYFGMKCGSSWTGKSVNLSTKEEYIKGTLTTIRDNFRVYDTMEAGVKGYFDFLNYARYKNVKDATSEINFFERLRDSGYYTSKSYVETMGAWLSECHKLVDGITTTSEDKPLIIDGGVVTVLSGLCDYIAHEVINGKYGTGETRKEALGEFYDIIQKRVNKIV